MVIQANHDSEYKDFNLSDKIQDWHYEHGCYEDLIQMKDVKEFIKRLKESLVDNYSLNEIFVNSFKRDIDKLAGDKLTEK